jgi:hypothetical protein
LEAAVAELGWFFKVWFVLIHISAAAALLAGLSNINA